MRLMLSIWTHVYVAHRVCSPNNRVNDPCQMSNVGTGTYLTACRSVSEVIEMLPTL